MKRKIDPVMFQTTNQFGSVEEKKRLHWDSTHKAERFFEAAEWGFLHMIEPSNPRWASEITSANQTRQ